VIRPRKGEIEERVAGDTSVVGEECIQGASLVNVELGIISWGIINGPWHLSRRIMDCGEYELRYRTSVHDKELVR